MPRNVYQQKDINGKVIPGDLVVEDLIVTDDVSVGDDLGVTGDITGGTVTAGTALASNGTFQVAQGSIFLGNVTATTGVNLFIFPGPYANDAAAQAAGVPVGGLYRAAAGALAWRQV